jgi:MerR family copper efflux transcriptional regulator
MERVMNMNIGEASALTGVPAKTIRYYESMGLLHPARSGGNYRVYGEHEIQMLRFIQRARRLGFSVKEVENLLLLWQDKHRTSAQVRALAAAHIEEIDRKLEELKRIRETLQTLVHRCHGDDRPDCPIIEELAR